MHKSESWIYRKLYDRHYLMSIETNEILCISNAIAELFISSDLTEAPFEDTYAKWCHNNELEYENHILAFLKKKGVVYAEV